MRFVKFDKNTLNIIEVVSDTSAKIDGDYLYLYDDVVDASLLKINLLDNQYVVYKGYKYVNNIKTEDYSEYWAIVKHKCMTQIVDTSFVVDGMLYLSNDNRILWEAYRNDLMCIINADVTTNPYAITIPTKPSFELCTGNDFLKISTRYKISNVVGDLYDLVTDVSKNMNLIERLSSRLFLHVFDVKPMDQEKITNYSAHCLNYIDAVDSGSFIDSADLDDEVDLINKLTIRRNQISNIVKTEYIDKKI